MTEPRLDYPLEHIEAAAAKVIEQGGAIYQKFTCAGCGARQAMDVPNVLYTSGSCEECGHVTDIAAQGCNYIVVFST